MSFGTNLQALRRRSGMTQEGLADALGVSRQSVSKWESDGSFPEMEKLVQLCDLFGCPLDMLVRGDVEAESSGEAADALAAREAGMAYDRHTRFAARAVTLGVGLVLFGVALLMLLYGMNPTDRMSIIGTALMLAFITAAVALFIVYGCRHEAFRKKYPEITVSPYTAEEAERFDRLFPLFIAGGVALILLGVIFLVCCPLFIPRFETPSRASFATGLFLLILDAGVMLIVYGAMTKARYNTGEYNREAAGSESDEGDSWSGAIMLTATVAYLLMGFVWNLWHPGWVVFPIGGILCGIVSSIRSARKAARADRDS